jgi:hypothetical protein
METLSESRFKSHGPKIDLLTTIPTLSPHKATTRKPQKTERLLRFSLEGQSAHVTKKRQTPANTIKGSSRTMVVDPGRQRRTVTATALRVNAFQSALTRLTATHLLLDSV